MSSQRQSFVTSRIFAELYTFNGGVAENNGRVVATDFRTTAYNAIQNNDNVGPDVGLIPPAQLPLRNSAPGAGPIDRTRRRDVYSDSQLIFVVEVSSHGLTPALTKINTIWMNGPGVLLQEAWAINVAQRRLQIWTVAGGWGPVITFAAAGIVIPGVPTGINGFAFNFGNLANDIFANFV